MSHWWDFLDGSDGIEASSRPVQGASERAMATKLSPEVQWMRRRLRHIHIPDVPPIYAPRSLATNIRDHISGQILRQRALVEEAPRPDPEYGFAKIPPNAQMSFTSWLERAGPPPTVLSFTRRPTYILPKHQVQQQEQWQIEYLTKALQSKIDLHFPEPPEWSSLPWRPLWEQKLPKSEWKHDPLNHQWQDVGVLIMPCEQAMFLGPGQVSIWPIIDLQDEIQRGRVKLTTKYQFERILEDTTIELLKREFGIQAFAIPGSTGVWVESRIPPPEVDVEQFEAAQAKNAPETLSGSLRRRNVRRIATVHTSITNDITHWGVSIHVGQPEPTVDPWARSTNPWTPLRQHHTTTSIAAELSYMDSTMRPLGPSKYLVTHFNHTKRPLRAGQGYIPYSRITDESDRRHPAPLGMDNSDISTAWTYQFARQLGMGDGLVDHYGMVDVDDTHATLLPTKNSEAGFKFNGVFEDDVMTSAYRQVDVPSIQVGRNESVSSSIVQSSLRLESHDGKIDWATHKGWLLSWPLWESRLLNKLDDAICGGPCDTRMRTYGLQKQASSRLQRRRTELKGVKEVEQEWRKGMPELIRRPLSDNAIQELFDRSHKMESILKAARIGTTSQMLLKHTIEMRRLLETRFAGAFLGHSGAPEPELKDPLPAPEARSQEAPTAPPGDTSTREPAAREASTAQTGISSGENPVVDRPWFDLTPTKAEERERKREERRRRRQEREKDPEVRERMRQEREKNFQERIKMLQERVKDRVILRRRPHELMVDNTKTNADRRRENDELRRARAAEEVREAAVEAEDGQTAASKGTSPLLPITHRIEEREAPAAYLPNTQQIGEESSTPGALKRVHAVYRARLYE